VRLGISIMMNRLRDLLVDGILLALPLGVAAFLLRRVFGALVSVMAPVAHLLPQGRWYGIAALELAAVALALFGLLALGAFARSAPGRRLVARLESLVLGKFPGYMMMKSIAADFGGAQSDSGMQPALVSFDDNTVLGYIVEDAGAAGLLTVFIPSAPSAGSGSVVMVPRERVRPLKAASNAVRHTMKQRGVGLQELTRAGEAVPGTRA
jgi:uncharacterized membrane protein